MIVLWGLHIIILIIIVFTERTLIFHDQMERPTHTQPWTSHQSPEWGMMVALRHEMCWGEGSAGWIFTPTGISVGWNLTPTRSIKLSQKDSKRVAKYENFISIAQKERFKMKKKMIPNRSMFDIWILIPPPPPPHTHTHTHTAHTIVSWPNPKQWVIVHTSDLMMIIKQSIYIYIYIYPSDSHSYWKFAQLYKKAHSFYQDPNAQLNDSHW